LEVSAHLCFVFCNRRKGLGYFKLFSFISYWYCGHGTQPWSYATI